VYDNGNGSFLFDGRECRINLAGFAQPGFVPTLPKLQLLIGVLTRCGPVGRVATVGRKRHHCRLACTAQPHG
jgi:hypothetical protein